LIKKKKTWHAKKKKIKNQMTSEFSSVQVFIPSSIALVLALIGLIISILAKVQVNEIIAKDKLNESKILSVASTNGFAGVIKDQVATFSITVQGLLFGLENGITQALDTEITKSLLTGFSSQASNATNITKKDSILKALQKCAVLKHTRLTNFETDTSGSEVTSSDTMFSALQKMQGISNQSFYLFSVNQLTPLNVGPFWTGQAFGSVILPPNIIKPGTAITIKNSGDIIFGAAPIVTLTLSFQGIMFTISKAFLVVPTSVSFTHEIVFVCQTDTNMCVSNRLVMSEPSFALTIGINTPQQTFAFDPTVACPLDYTGNITGTNSSILVRVGVGSISYNPI
jgi:hypothetical protein